MTEGGAFARYWSDDGVVLIAPDLMLHVAPMLERAAEQYGPVRWEGEWALGGVFFYGEDPCVRPVPGFDRVVIQLPAIGAEQDLIALAFLAHELVHCLHLSSPRMERTAPLIEEGAAVRFSLIEAEALDANFAAQMRTHQTSAPGTEDYALALWGVEALLAINPEAIRTLRAEDPDWGAITPERIRAVAPGILDGWPELLCEVREMRPDPDRAAAVAELERRAAGRRPACREADNLGARPA